MSWPVFLVAVAAFALALVPTRRLFLSGWRPAPLAFYLGLLIALGVTAVFVRAGIRVVVPVLLVLYVLPFIGAPAIVPRTIARIGSGRGARPGGTVVDGTARRSTGGDASTAGTSGGPDGMTPDAGPRPPEDADAGTPAPPRDHG